MYKFIKSIKEFWLSFFTFTIFISSFFIFFTINKNDQINRNINLLQETYNTQYNITYDNFKRLSQNTFFGIINKPIVFEQIKKANISENKDIYRKKLYETFISDYNRLREYHFEQVHFHTKDNKSFLRMHKPEKYGDDLTNIRKSVVEVNKTLKPIEGFEIGKIIHGFRFVYPLFDENLFHIASVEVSISSNFFEKTYEKNYNADMHFLVNKAICKEKMFEDDYKKLNISNENEDYLFIEDKKELLHYTKDKFYTKEEKLFIKHNMQNGIDFIFQKKDHKGLIVYFKAIKDVSHVKNSAYIVVYTTSDYILQIEKNYTVVLFSLLLLTIIFIFLMNTRYDNLIKNRTKKELFNQQSKLASMGEMINNIAHQWRQPLSIISTSASGVKLQNEFGTLDNESLDKAMDIIVKQTENLSKTIEDFRNFSLDKKRKQPFYINKSIEDSLLFFDSIFNDHNIKVIKNLKQVEIISFHEEFKQVVTILIKNAIDAIKNDGLILINVMETKDEIIIKIQDSGGGIDKNSIHKVFDPYYSTKHKSIGIGIGLYTSHELITNSFQGSLNAENQEFNYQFKHYKGACFTIKLLKENL